MTLRLSIDLPETERKEAFDRFSSELMVNLELRGITGTFSRGGVLNHGKSQIGKVVGWNESESISIDWWTPETRGSDFVSRIKVSFQPIVKDPGTTVTVEYDGWEYVLTHTGADIMDWFMSSIIGHVFQTTIPENYGNWLTDRYARKPSGAISRSMYAHPIYHIPNFKVILKYLQPKEDDYLLEVGCGGGYLLREILKTGCRAAAIDHSPDMVAVARGQNSEKIEQGRLEIREGEAEALPFSEGQFSCAVSTGVFNFTRNPKAFLSEIYRVLQHGGRFFLYSGSKELKGTPADIDPIAEDTLIYREDDELVALAESVGFTRVSLERPDLKDFAIEAGVPEEAMEIFSIPGGGGQLLIAFKP